MNIIVGIDDFGGADALAAFVERRLANGDAVRLAVAPEIAGDFAALEEKIGSALVSDARREERLYGALWHVKLVEWCDAAFVAPCSASTLARLATGLCDTALTITASAVLGAKKPLALAHALDATLAASPAVCRNLETLRRDGALVLAPEAIGESGLVRLPGAEQLEKTLQEALAKENAARRAEPKPNREENDPEAAAREEIRRAVETPLVSLEDKSAADKLSDEIAVEADFIKLKNERSHGA